MRVLTIGTFDLLHVGHLELIHACRELAGPDGFVIVAVNSDDFVERYKGRRPAVPYAERVEMLRALHDVDFVGPNAGDEIAGEVIWATSPDYLLVGDDWQDRDYLGQLHVTQEFLDSLGVEVVYVPRTRGVSTTSLRG